MANVPQNRTGVDRDEESRVLAGCLKGDRQAQETLARWVLPRVRRCVFFTYGNGPDGDDLAQAALERIFGRMQSFRGETAFYVWVDRITVNVVRDSFRKKRLPFALDLFRDQGVNPAETLIVDENSPDEAADRYDLMRRLVGHFEAIKPRRRIPLVLSLLQGYTVPEIAAILNVTFDSAKKRLQRGRRDLAAILLKDPVCREAIEELGR